MVKAQLLSLIRENKPRVIYATQVIATERGHRVLFTPPYHPELQPIELIWGAGKNKIAQNPASTMADLGEKLVVAFDGITSKSWVGAYRKAQDHEDMYMSNIDEIILGDEIDDDEDEDDEERVELHDNDNS